jgi:adenosylcobinamide kinase/adenosylcobinamide-phosphate guanylyltransferase
MLAFLLGGARSGKSTIALGLARSAAPAGSPVTVVVTAEAGDDEMARRIARHRAERDAGWPTVDAPHELPAACAALDDDGVVVVDCVSFWVANRVMAGADEDDIRADAARLAAWAATRRGWTVVVSNEVGAGVVPDNELARRFRDALGRANASLAARAARSWYVAAGRTLPLRPAPETLA